MLKGNQVPGRLAADDLDEVLRISRFDPGGPQRHGPPLSPRPLPATLLSATRLDFQRAVAAGEHNA